MRPANTPAGHAPADTSQSIQTNPRREQHPCSTPSPPPRRACQLADTDEAVLAFAVTSREPDRDVPEDELAWWLMRQERMEIRAELSAHGLL